MSEDVTEPKSLPSSPTRAENVRETCSSLVASSEAEPRLASRLLQALTLLLDALAVAGRSLVGKAARQQVVPRIAGGDLHDIARMTELFNCLSEYDFH